MKLTGICFFVCGKKFLLQNSEEKNHPCFYFFGLQIRGLLSFGLQTRNDGTAIAKDAIQSGVFGVSKFHVRFIKEIRL